MSPVSNRLSVSNIRKAQYKEGDTFCYIQAPWGEIVPIPAALGGKLVEVSAKQGAKVRRGDNLAWIERG